MAIVAEHFTPLNLTSIQFAALVAINDSPGLDATRGPVFSDETHAIAAALAGQGVALMSRVLIEPELAAGTLVAPFGPVLAGRPFYLVYPSERVDEASVAAVRDWLLPA